MYEFYRKYRKFAKSGKKEKRIEEKGIIVAGERYLTEKSKCSKKEDIRKQRGQGRSGPVLGDITMQEKINNYTALAESYRQMAEDGCISRETADKEIRVLDFLGSCTEEDLCRIMDSGALNGIVRAYVRVALDWSSCSEEMSGEVLDCLYHVFDQLQTCEVLKNNRRQ
jgi:hypothetical protein